jgi:cystathionine beta-lyase/cystathionine gamma-synthase
MKENTIQKYITSVVENTPEDWLNLTTHRLDIYNEDLAKTEFLSAFENLFEADRFSTEDLTELPTAYDYIRLGHPLSSVLEWTIAKLNNLNPERVICFSSKTMPILAILRKNLCDGKPTHIVYDEKLPLNLKTETLRHVYGYDFELNHVDTINSVLELDGSTVYISYQQNLSKLPYNPNIDFYIVIHPELGSVLVAQGSDNDNYIADIQHVRRRETIAMTPHDCFTALKQIINVPVKVDDGDNEAYKAKVVAEVNNITRTSSKVLLGSSGLSVQYAIMMGLIDDAMEKYPNKAIKIIVPPNCYGGTNDQARRVAATKENVEILDLLVDRDHDMAQSTNQILDQVAAEDAIPLIIAEIPTNPRVEVPDLEELRNALVKQRKTKKGTLAIDPIFILDQTFCPNVQFCADDSILSSVRTISYVSGSKFPSGGKCTAGYCVANSKAKSLLDKIQAHLFICDNEATDLQVKILAEQLPSMVKRIEKAYKNTLEFVRYIEKTLPSAKINFVSEELAKEGFMPSVFSLDLPTKGETMEAREMYKRKLNKKLITKMITEIPEESKYCVSYGQLNGCYWTIPATSTQGTTKEADKDYIARVSVSPNLNLERHKEVFADFAAKIEK